MVELLVLLLPQKVSLGSGCVYAGGDSESLFNGIYWVVQCHGESLCPEGSVYVWQMGVDRF